MDLDLVQQAMRCASCSFFILQDMEECNRKWAGFLVRRFTDLANLPASSILQQSRPDIAAL